MNAIQTVTPKTLTTWLETGEAFLLDVREPAEHRSESINSAMNIPLGKVKSDKDKLSDMKGKKLVVHCKSGARSRQACEQLATSDSTFEIWNLEGGLEAWKSEGLPILESKRKVLPLDRQVQLTISLMNLIGLGFFATGNTWGLVLPLIAGLGLLNASLTGWCGMALLMAKMPWNK